MPKGSSLAGNQPSAQVWVEIVLLSYGPGFGSLPSLRCPCREPRAWHLPTQTPHTASSFLEPRACDVKSLFARGHTADGFESPPSGMALAPGFVGARAWLLEEGLRVSPWTHRGAQPLMLAQPRPSSLCCPREMRPNFRKSQTHRLLSFRGKK